MDIIAITSKVVFAKEDINQLFDTPAACRYWLEMAIANRLIERVRRDLYAVIDLTTGNVYANKYLIGSCISPTACIAYHSALEFHGLANQVYNIMYVSDSRKFRSFEFADVEYEFVFNDNQKGIDRINYGEVLRVTDKERTLIDCIDKMKYSGGIEEVLNALGSIRNMQEYNLLEMLNHYDNIHLWQKAGYLLSMFKDELHLTSGFLNQMKTKTGDIKRYFLNNDGMDCVYYPDWKLYAPTYESLEAHLQGRREV